MKTVLITGANRGIGLEHVARFAEQGVTVFAGVRKRQAANALQKIADKSQGRVHLFEYDALDPAAPGNAKAALNGRPLDLLFANAGIFGGDQQDLGDLSAESFLETYQVNTLAPLLLADALVDEVSASNRKLIALQSSKMGSNVGSRSPGDYAYRASKAALNKIASTLASELKPRGITVVSLHPGWVRTDMGGQGADIDVATSVAGQQALFKTLSLEQSGGFFNYDGRRIDW